MPAQQDLPPADVTKLVEQNTNAMRAVQGQLQKMNEQLAGFGTLRTSTEPIGQQAAAQIPFETLGSPPAAVNPRSSQPFGSLPQNLRTAVGAVPQTGQIQGSPVQAQQTSPTVGSYQRGQPIQAASSIAPSFQGLTGSFGTVEEQVPTQISQMASEKQQLPPVTRQPTVDLVDLEDAFVLEADLPGVSKEELELTVFGNKILIQAEVEPGSEEGAVLVGERVPTVYRRSLRLPVEIEAEEVEATLEDGILRVQLPKIESGAGPHRVSIK